MRKLFVISLVLSALAGGCSEPDHRAIELATQGAERQAQQNQVVADLGRQMAENHRKMVESVQQSRSELVALQTELTGQREQLERERQAIARERRVESLLAAVAEPAGWFALASLPLVLCWLLLVDLRRTGGDDPQLSQLVVDQFLPAGSPMPLGLPDSRQPPAVGHDQPDGSSGEPPPF